MQETQTRTCFKLKKKSEQHNRGDEMPGQNFGWREWWSDAESWLDGGSDGKSTRHSG